MGRSVTAVHHPWTRLSVGTFTSLLDFFELAVDLHFFVLVQFSSDKKLFLSI
jgi:hypothetical protein